MKFIVEFRLKPGVKNKVVDTFEMRGPSHNIGVAFKDAWIGTQSDLIFVLTESADEQLVVQACDHWREFGDFVIHPVINFEQF